MNGLEEFRNEAYDNAKIYKEKTRRWHDQKILRREFKAGEQVLLYNFRLKVFPRKLKQRWSGPYTVLSSTPFRAVTLKTECHALIPGPTRLADPNRVQGARLKTRTLCLFFFFFKPTGTCGYGPHLITIQNIIYIYRVPFTITKLYFYIYKSEHITYM